MAAELKLVEEAKKPLSMNPKKFALWLFIVSVIMVFAALTSAYIVRQAEGNWLIFELPQLFWITSVIILISSGTMHWAYLAAKRDSLESVKLATSITTILGVAFLVGQVMAWNDLVADNVFFCRKSLRLFCLCFIGLTWLAYTRRGCFFAYFTSINF